MAAKPRKYVPGWRGTLILDGDPFAIMGWSSQDTVDEVDLSTTEDGPWSLTEMGLRSVSITFSLPIKAADTVTPLENGGIYECSFLINDVVKYEGDFIVTSCNLSNPIRGASTYEVTVKNYGSVSPTP